MKNTYLDLIEQSYQFPQEGFGLEDDYLTFHGVSLQQLIVKYGTPFKLFYLPKITEQITKARALFSKAFKNNGYTGKYHYCYCTKCCHFSPMIKTALNEKVHLETSSSFDIDLIFRLLEGGELDKETTIIHNGPKTDEYLHKILKLSHSKLVNSVIVLDSKLELAKVKALTVNYKGIINLGIRIAIDEEPQSIYFSSRLGIRPNEIVDFYLSEINSDDKLELTMVHFFVDSGIRDEVYYWDEFKKALKVFVDLRQSGADTSVFNLGGGFPIRNSLNFSYNFDYMANEIVAQIKAVCSEAQIREPDIYTEFGRYTVGESGAVIFRVLEKKHQNDSEKWYMVDGSLMNTLPDSWSTKEKFLLLPINKWDNEYDKVNIGGISCDHADNYSTEEVNQQLFLPKYDNEEKEPLYVGFFHSGAYQEAIGGYGGIKHCLIPAPKIIIIENDGSGKLSDYVFREEQKVTAMLDILGY